MKFILSVVILLFTISCDTQEEKRKKETDKLVMEVRKQEMFDSIIKISTKNLMFDTVGLSNSPVKVLKAFLIEKEYSNYKDISLTYKNVSIRKIEAIKFKWYGLNAFGEPADMGGSFLEGFGGGFTDDPISAGKTRTNKWDISSKDGKNIVLAWAYEVVFTDGTKWKCGKGK